MSTIRGVGIDIAKSVFQVCLWIIDGPLAWKKFAHSKLPDTIRPFKAGTLIEIEARATSHFWEQAFATKVIKSDLSLHNT